LVLVVDEGNTEDLKKKVEEFMQRAGYNNVTVGEPAKLSDHPVDNVYVDEQGYPCMDDKRGLEGPGIWWTKEGAQWKAYADHLLSYETEEPLYTCSSKYDFPTNDDFETARAEYEKWWKLYKEEVEHGNQSES
jgi:hypothetical protein